MDEAEPRGGDPWRPWEVDLLVAAYFDILDAEARGERPNKADVNRRLQGLLPARSRGSIEYKLQNVSGVLYEQQLPFIDGYKPAANYQADLRRAVDQWLAMNRRAAESLAAYGSSVPAQPPTSGRLRDVLVERPAGRGVRREGAHLGISQGAWGALRDAEHRVLGERGERWVMELERSELRALGRTDLAERVEWTSGEKGDGFGYDVSSFEPDGQPIQIEVKTTNFGPRAPFHVTKNEVAKSEDLADTYRLYRVFEFARGPRLFIVPGAVSRHFALDPLDYLARPN